MRIGTLFSGIGAPEQAAARVWPNHEIAFACEWDKFARQSYLANYEIDEAHFHTDVRELDGTQYRGKVDILVGGSPCQAFSVAGLRGGTADDRGGLIYEYIRVVEEVKAPVIVYENVKGMLSIDGGRTIKEFVQVLRDIGYYYHYEILNTKDYGVPQNRERLFLVGFLDHEAYYRFAFAPKVPLTKRLKDVLEENVDEKYYLSQKMTEYLYSHGDRHLSFNGRFKIKNIYDDIANCLCKSHDTCSTDNFIQDERGIRKLTNLEKLRLQDFPDVFKQVVSDTQITAQTGNSMTVAVVEMIFRQIDKALTGQVNNTSLFGGVQ